MGMGLTEGSSAALQHRWVYVRGVSCCVGRSNIRGRRFPGPPWRGRRAGVVAVYCLSAAGQLVSMIARPGTVRNGLLSSKSECRRMTCRQVVQELLEDPLCSGFPLLSLPFALLAGHEAAVLDRMLPMKASGESGSASRNLVHSPSLLARDRSRTEWRAGRMRPTSSRGSAGRAGRRRQSPRRRPGRAPGPGGATGCGNPFTHWALVQPAALGNVVLAPVVLVVLVSQQQQFTV